MKEIQKLRIKNTYFYIALSVLILILGITWFFESNCAEILFFTDYNTPEWGNSDKFKIKMELLSSVLTWERFIDSSMRYVMHLFPIFAVIPAVPFLFERKSYFIYGSIRFKNHTVGLVKAIIHYTISGGFCISLAFVIYFSVGNIVMIPSIENIGGFASVFPKDFYANHSYLFFVFMAVTIYFSIGCAFACMSCAVALFTDKEYYVLIIPVLAYIGLSYIGGGFGIPLLQISSCVGAYNTLYSTLESFRPLVPILLVDILLIFIGLYRRKKAIEY